MTKFLLVSIICSIFTVSIAAQYVDGSSIKYGNEWIDYNMDYYKIQINDDGIYRIGRDELISAGYPVTSVPMSEMTIYKNGIEIYLHTSTEGVMGQNDYLEFYAYKNRNEIDRYAFDDENNQLNPDFSLITDVSAYFLTHGVGEKLRYATSNTDVSGNLPPVEQFYMHYEKNTFAESNGFWKAPTSAVRYSTMTKGEGYGLGMKNSVSKSIPISNHFTSGPDPYASVRFTTNINQHNTTFKIDNSIVKSFNFSGYQIVSENISFSKNLLKTNTSLKVNGSNSTIDQFNISEFSITYPRTFNFGGNNEAHFKFDNSPFDRYIELKEFDISGDAPIIYDLKTRRRITTVVENDVVKFISPSSIIDNEFHIFNSNAVKEVMNIGSVEFIDYSLLSHDYLILSNEELYDDPQSGENWVQKYADYRNTSMGGGFNPIIVDAQQVYDQFGYGIDKHFLGVKAFFQFLNKEWDDLEYIFIIGKAREYAFYRFDAQINADPDFHAPTYGYPGSDNMLSASWGNTAPNVAIGRLAARSADEVRKYLDKVFAHEMQINNPQTIEDKLWMKKVLHLSGGDPAIKELLKSYLGNMESILETNHFGANVKTYYKTSSDPVELPQSEEILNLINDGLAMITFFGHSAVGVFDLNLEDVEEYSNENRYPLIISLGCHSGNVHTASQNGLSEKFVHAEKKGAIAFLAASSQAYIPQQYEFGKNFYDFIGDGMYNESIGKVAKRVNENSDYLTSSAWETLLQQLTLHGDPAVKLNVNLGEDYTPAFSSVHINPEVVSAFEEDFQVCFDVANLGYSDPKEMSINLQHISPSNEILTDSSFTVITPTYLKNYCVTIPISNQNIVGKNTLKIFVDDKLIIPEIPNPMAENNNGLVNSSGGDGFDFFVLNNGAVPVKPKNYAIYNMQDVVLQASTYNSLGDKQNYIVQLDTTDSFNSPLLVNEVIENVTSLITWTPNTSFVPATVYYWRISPEGGSVNPGLVWNEASFLYLPNANGGWNQSHVNQYDDNEFDNLEIAANSDLDYVANFREIRVLNTVSANGDDANFFHVGTFLGFCYLRDWGPWIAVTPLDSIGNWYFHYPNDPSGAEIPGNGSVSFTYYFNPNTQEGRIDLVNFIDNTLNDGDYVYLYSIMPKNNFAPDFSTDEWAADSIVNNGKNIFNVLEQQGAERISEFRDEPMVPYNYFYRKNVGQLAEGKADDIYSAADNSAQVFGRWFTGTETTEQIGPSSKWTKLVWKDKLSSTPANDSSYINIIGVSPEGIETVLRERQVEKEINLAQISADEYPYLKLQYYTFDNKTRSSADLVFWRVFYNGVSELALDFLSEGIFTSDSLDQGDDFLLQLPLRNLGLENVDSINVRISVVDQDNTSVFSTQKTSPIEPGEFSTITLEIPTDNLSGEYSVNIEANYDKAPPECFYFNNLAIRKFIVKKDQRNPLLDVSFDGRRIINGDIVSAEPIIRVVTKDENRYLLMNDTSHYQLAVIDPDGIETKLSFDNPNIIFTPAISIDNNQSEILYSPTFEKDGLYILKVASEDASGNISGNKEFSVEFRIINEELISNVLNYPNPFSDCTQFIFTLTGNELPEELGIRIMTVSGKVVREIRGIELGPLHIGVNRTEYKWDGTDEFGSKLANGVYLYQIVSKKIGGENYNKYDTNTNQFFLNNIGKMVIIR